MPSLPDRDVARPLTIDGDVGLPDEEATLYARGYFLGGFFFLPWLWFANAYLFWPVLTKRAGGTSTPLYRCKFSLGELSITATNRV